MMMTTTAMIMLVPFAMIGRYPGCDDDWNYDDDDNDYDSYDNARVVDGRW